jgi:hypothetical protein
MNITAARIMSAQQRINKIDLEKVAKILVYKGWSADRIRTSLGHYRKFLVIIALSEGGHRVIAPTEDIYTVWRVHHLQWMDYYEDCVHTGIRLVNPLWRRKPLIFRMGYRRDLEETRSLWRLIFNEEPPTEAHDEKHCLPLTIADEQE